MQLRRTLTPCLRRRRRGRQVTLSLLERERGALVGTVSGSPNRDPRRGHSSSPLPALCLFSGALFSSPSPPLPEERAGERRLHRPVSPGFPPPRPSPRSSLAGRGGHSANTLNRYPARSGERIKVRGASDCILRANSRLKKPPGEGTGPTLHADFRRNLVGRVPSRGEQAFLNGLQRPPPLKIRHLLFSDSARSERTSPD